MPRGSGCALVAAARLARARGALFGSRLRLNCRRKRLPAHRFADQRLGRIRENIGLRLAEDRLLADLQHDRHGERRDAFEPLMHDSALHAKEHFTEPPMSSSPVAASARVACSRMWSGSWVRSTS